MDKAAKRVVCAYGAAGVLSQLLFGFIYFAMRDEFVFAPNLRKLGCAASGESQRDSDGLLLCARRDSAVRRGGGGRAPFGAAGLCSADPRALEAHPAARRVCRRGALLPRGGTPGGASADVYGVSPVGVCVSRAAWAAAGGAAGAASA